MAVAGITALAAHLLLLVSLRGAEHPADRATTPAAASQEYELDTRALEPPVPPAAKPEQAPIEKGPPPPRIRAALASRAPAPAARAASVVAQEPDPGAPVDLTGDAIVTGQATAYAGGVTTCGGNQRVSRS